MNGFPHLGPAGKWTAYNSCFRILHWNCYIYPIKSPVSNFFLTLQFIIIWVLVRWHPFVTVFDWKEWSWVRFGPISKFYLGSIPPYLQRKILSGSMTFVCWFFEVVWLIVKPTSWYTREVLGTCTEKKSIAP